MAGLEGLLTGHTLVKRYQIEEVIGRGGFAVVYRAMDTRLDRPVAVKVITLSAADPEQRETLRQRLHREAQAAASLPHHPNLVTVHDVGTDPELGLDFLVMELLRGENLSQMLARAGRPTLDRALCILRDAAQGLAVGHRAGLIHRDVKPGNIFLAEAIEGGTDGFRVCVLDYGIAQAIEDDQTVTRGMGANPLSPAFASPEQIRGERNLTAATDVFSLGVVGYQLLTGERPFTSEPGQMPTGWTVRTPIRELNPQVPPQVEQVVMRAMSVEPGARFPDADAFLSALGAATHRDLKTQVHAALSHFAVPPPELDIDEDEGTMIAPPRTSIRVVPPNDDAGTVVGPAPASISVTPPDDDEGTVIAPAPAAAPVRPAAHVSSAPRTVPPSTTRRRGRMPVVLMVALLLVAAAAWAALSGGGGDDGAPRAEPGAVPVTSASGDEPEVGPPPVPGDAPVTREGFGIGGESQPSGSVPAFGDQPSSPSGSTGGRQPAPSTPSQPSAGQPQRPPAAQPQPQPQPQRPSVPAQQPPVSRPPPQQRPPAQQPPVQQPPVQQPPVQQPPVQQPPPQPQPPPVQEPPPIQEPPPQPRPEPPVVGQPVPPRPDAPRDTIFIGFPPR